MTPKSQEKLQLVHEHKFEKLAEGSIWCRCGEIRTAPAVPSCGCHSQCVHWWYGYPYAPVVSPTWTVSSGGFGTASWNG